MIFRSTISNLTWTGILTLALQAVCVTTYAQDQFADGEVDSPAPLFPLDAATYNFGDTVPSVLDSTGLAAGPPDWNEAIGPGGFASCCGDCPPGWRVRAEGLLLTRENSRVTYSNAFGLGGLGSQEGSRISLIRHLDCLDAWEVTYIGPYSWEESGQVAGVGLSSRLNSATLNLSEFNNATLHTQNYRSELNSVEFNRRWFGWNVISTFAGFRYLNLAEDFSFQSTGAAGTGTLAVETNNHLFGPQIGMELMYPVGSWMTTTSMKGGMFANVIDGNALMINNGALQFANSDDDIEFAATIEIGYGVSFQVTPRIKVRGGYEFWWLYGLALAPDQVGSVLTAQSGSKVQTSNSTYYHGATAGVEVEW